MPGTPEPQTEESIRASEEMAKQVQTRHRCQGLLNSVLIGDLSIGSAITESLTTREELTEADCQKASPK